MDISLEPFKLGSINDYVVLIGKVKEQVGISCFLLGKIMYEIQEQELWKEQFDSFEEFLGSPEVSVSRPTVYKAITVYKKFGLELNAVKQIKGIDFDKLYRITKVVNKDNLDEWLLKANTASRSDLAVDVRGIQGLPVLDPARGIREHIKDFLYEHCKEAGLEPAEMELEELLLEWENFKRSRR